MNALDRILETARRSPRHVVLAEGEDPRIQDAAVRAARDGLARLTLLGDETRIGMTMAARGAAGLAIAVENPLNSPRLQRYAAAYLDLRRRKGVDEAAAVRAMSEPLGHAAMMVRQGDADGSIGGAVTTTADTVRAAIQIIGRAPESRIVSSFFLMMQCEPHHARKGAFVFSDCGLVVAPDAGQLAAIAIASAASYEALTGEPARVGMLSFSTHGSASHARVDKVTQALAMAREQAPGLLIDGELQFDAAFVESVAAAKCPSSPIRGAANVLVFPDLDSGNIGYKIAQRIGGAVAIGPILQGLARPANDLSRGCSADDVYHLIAVTVVQAQQVAVDAGAAGL